MKIYVDELPRSCHECPISHIDKEFPFEGQLLCGAIEADINLHAAGLVQYEYKKRHADCPLLSISIMVEQAVLTEVKVLELTKELKIVNEAIESMSNYMPLNTECSYCQFSTEEIPCNVEKGECTCSEFIKDWFIKKAREKE